MKQINPPAQDSLRLLKADLEELRARFKSLGFELQESWIEPLWKYVRLLLRWSKSINLVSSGDRSNIFTKHVGPACLMANVIQSLDHETIIDYGSGAGLPGIPLKIAFPDSLIYLVESRRRRATFLRTVARELCLEKLNVVNLRLDDWQCPAGAVDLVVSRATGGNLSDLVGPFVKPQGQIVTTVGSVKTDHPARGTCVEFPGFPTVHCVPVVHMGN